MITPAVFVSKNSIGADMIPFVILSCNSPFVVTISLIKDALTAAIKNGVKIEMAKKETVQNNHRRTNILKLIFPFYLEILVWVSPSGNPHKDRFCV